MAPPRSAVIRDVGPRDGLQPEAPIPVEQRVRLIELLVDAGLRRIEVCSFVSPAAVPAMAEAASVVAHVHPFHGLVRTALVPNVRGAELALMAGVEELTVTVAASPEYNRRNVRMTIEESVEAIGKICELSDKRVAVDAVVSCAFGSPFEGDIWPAEVQSLCQRLIDAGVDAITLADTTGMATPRRIEEVVSLTGTNVGLHVHDTRGTALLNVYAALELGVTRFDTSIGGLGGSPSAPNPTGNVPTEEVVALFDDLGVLTGVDIERLLVASAYLAEIIGRPVPSKVATVGPRTTRPPSS